MNSRAREIATAVIDLAAEGGIEEITIRKVATRIGVSIGAVQHHYPTKESLLLAAIDLVAEEFRAEMSPRSTQAPLSRLRDFCHLLGATDPSMRKHAAVWLAFVGKAAVDDAVGEAHRATWRMVERIITEMLEDLPSPDPEWPARDRAAFLLALLDGIAVARVAEPRRINAPRARRLIDRGIDAVVG